MDWEGDCDGTLLEIRDYDVDQDIPPDNANGILEDESCGDNYQEMLFRV